MSDEFTPDDESQDDKNERRQADWVPSDAVSALATEREIHPDESHEDLARRLLKENVGPATLSIIHISSHGGNERLRLDASKYIVDRVLGKIGDEIKKDGEDPLQQFLSGVEAIANGAKADAGAGAGAGAGNSDSDSKSE